MRHRKARTNTLGGNSTYRRAMLSNMLNSLIEHGRLKTTQARARELRRVAERTLTRAVRLGDILLADWEQLEAGDRARLIHQLRLVQSTLRSREATLRLFREWAPRYLGRPGGYTSVYKLGKRPGDRAPMALVEFVPAELPSAADQPSGKSGAKAAAAAR